MTRTGLPTTASDDVASARPSLRVHGQVLTTAGRKQITPVGPTTVTVDAVSHTYAGGVHALKDVSFELVQGERVSILGESGSGKTSLLACLSGRLSPTAGSLHVEAPIATIHQDLRLVKQCSALANVLHGAMGRLPGYCSMCVPAPRAERERAIALLHRVGLGHRLHARVGRLSGGEQQRVAIARALMQQPRVLLADEPVASLDRRNAREIMRLLLEIGEEHNLTIICVLHDHELAQAFASRAILLDQGSKRYDGELDLARGVGEQCICHFDDPSEHDCSVSHCAKYQPEEDEHPMPRWVKPVQIGGIALVAAAVYVWAFTGLDISPRNLEGTLSGMGYFLADLIPGSWAQVAAIPWADISWSLVETIQMAIIGTTLGILVSWPMSALAARNVGPKGLRHVMRFILNTIRTIPSLIWALFFLAAVGFGSLAGVFALAAYSVGYLTKFFYEAFEGVEPGPPNALKEIGANGPQRFLHAVWPAAKPAILSSSLFMLEYNVRAASVLGIVGAGGIGFWFKHFYDYRMFPAMLACLILLLVVVVILDAVSNRLRAKLVQP